MTTTLSLVSVATCAARGSLRIVWIIAPPLIVALWGLLLVIAWRRTEAAGRLWLLAIFLMGLACSVFDFVPAVPGGGHNHLHRFLLVLGMAALVGIVIGLFSRAIGPLRGGWFAVAGNVVPVGITLMLLVWTLAIAGQCSIE